MISQEEFQAALQKFCEIVSPESEVIRKFDEVYAHIFYNRINSYQGIPDADGDQEADRWRHIRKYTEVNGRVMANASILFYMLQAIDIYERRIDEYAGQTALLFEPDTWHIKSIRHIIWLIKESDLGFDQVTEEFAAAIKIEEALNAVQQNKYLPHSIRKDGADIMVQGYTAGVSGGRYNVSKEGVVIRWYESKDVRQTVFEVTAANVLPNFFERNLYIDYAKGTTDIAVLMPDGSVARFNYLVSGSVESALFSHSPENEIQRWCTRMRNKGAGCTAKFTPEEITFITEKVIPYLVQARPPMVQLPVRMR